MNWTRLLPDLYLGSCPQSEGDVSAIADVGVSVVVNLQTDDDLHAYSLPWEELSMLYDRYNFEAAVRVEMIDGAYDSVLDELSTAAPADHIVGGLFNRHLLMGNQIS
ncbi:MAG: hypothetical protein AAFX99_35850, partial [Myxococcota bacterium]